MFKLVPVLSKKLKGDAMELATVGRGQGLHDRLVGVPNIYIKCVFEKVMVINNRE